MMGFLQKRCLLMVLLALGCCGSQTAETPASGGTTNLPRASVVAITDSQATTAFSPNREVVRRMVDAGVRAFASKAGLAEAWNSFLEPKDVVGFKVTSSPGAVSGTRPAVVRALVESLLSTGFPKTNIVIWDKRSVDLREAGWFRTAAEIGVACLASEDAGWDEAKFYDSSYSGRLVAGDLEFGHPDKENSGRRSHVTKLLTRRISKVITVAPVLSHNYAGVNGHLIGLALGSVDNTLRFAAEANRLSEVVPDICGLEDVLPKVVFGVSDALICQFRGEDTTLLHYARAMNEIRFSKDLVALDALALADIEKARKDNPLGADKVSGADLFANAELIEMGVATRERIDVHRVN